MLLPLPGKKQAALCIAMIEPPREILDCCFISSKKFLKMNKAKTVFWHVQRSILNRFFLLSKL
jgi:hypothetical protein